MEIQLDETKGGFVVSFPDLSDCITCGIQLNKHTTIQRMLKSAGLKQHLEIVFQFLNLVQKKIT